MTRLTFPEFDALYQSSVDDIWPHWSEAMQAEIARHCAAWAPGRIDFRKYLQASSVRFYHAYCSLFDSGSGSVCDVGGFWGVWPITAKKLGFEVAMTETLKYYGDSFGPLFDAIRNSGVDVHDYDPFSPDAAIQKRFDFVTVMAVLEHYPHSLRTFVENVKRLTAAGGSIYFEVPNIAYLPKRIELLRGRTPLAELGDIYRSEEPFIGHHHEFTIREMRDLARLSGLKIVSEDFYNYSLGGSGSGSVKAMLLHAAASLAFRFSKTCRECIAVRCVIAP